MGLGESGYVNAEITLTAGPAAYTGGGIAGWTGGTDYVFSVRMRSPNFKRQRQGVTDSFAEDAVGGPVMLTFDLEGFFKGADYPPDVFGDEVIRIACNAIFDFDAVVLSENFKPVGEIESGVKYTFNGSSVGAFSMNGQTYGP